MGVVGHIFKKILLYPKTDSFSSSKGFNTALFSRRSFIKSALSSSIFVTAYGCSSIDGGNISVGNLSPADNSTANLPDNSVVDDTTAIKYLSASHNCGGGCVLAVAVSCGKVTSILPNDTERNGELNGERAFTQRACVKCLAYRKSLYHSGRLKYPLRQSRERGDETAFIRISWQRAIDEISARVHAITGSYGAEAIHIIHATGSRGYSANSRRGLSVNSIKKHNAKSNELLVDILTSPAKSADNPLAGATTYSLSYGSHQYSFFSDNETYSGYKRDDNASGGSIAILPTIDDIIDNQRVIIFWGSNILDTTSLSPTLWIDAISKMKRRGDTKIIFISPQLTSTGNILADSWVQIKPYTDSALIFAIIYQMIADNSIDVDYVDSMVYGFCDSPQYYIHKTTGEIRTTNPNDDNFKIINSVKRGRSLLSYILGNGVLPATATASLWASYNSATSTNYIAKKFGGSSGAKTRYYECSYSSSDDTIFARKFDLKTPKTPEWASAKTGVPVETIKYLAKIYAKAGEQGYQIMNEVSYGLFRQYDGVPKLFALEALNIICKNWGVAGATISRDSISLENDNIKQKSEAIFPKIWQEDIKLKHTPIISATAWSSAIKFAFAKELLHNGYKPNSPNINLADRIEDSSKHRTAIYDDISASTLISWCYDDDGNPLRLSSAGKTFYRWRDKISGLPAPTLSSEPIYSGVRLVFNIAGNTPINQHPNTFDTTDMIKRLPTYYKDIGNNCGYDVDNIADAFCLITVDRFMTPTARYSDYILPSTTPFEEVDFRSLKYGNTILSDKVVEPYYECKSLWDICSMVAGVGSYLPKLSADYFKNITESSSDDYGVSSSKPYTESSMKISSSSLYVSELRQATDSYLASADKGTLPFSYLIPTIDSDKVEDDKFGGNSFATLSPTNQFDEQDPLPNQSGRFQVYSDMLTWRYRYLNSRWRGYLNDDERMRNCADREGDDFLLPIPIYHAPEDYFINAYNLASSSELDGKLAVVITHSSSRLNSTFAENPYLRELTHRRVGGGLCNDSNNYATAPNHDNAKQNFDKINQFVGGVDYNVSYAEILLNSADASRLSIADGNLIMLESSYKVGGVDKRLGAIYGVAKVTEKVVKGAVSISSGNWLDIRRLADGLSVDIGGNCNSLIATEPTLYDNGLALGMAMVSIKKI